MDLPFVRLLSFSLGFGHGLPFRPNAKTTIVLLPPFAVPSIIVRAYRRLDVHALAKFSHSHSISRFLDVLSVCRSYERTRRWQVIPRGNPGPRKDNQFHDDVEFRRWSRDTRQIHLATLFPRTYIYMRTHSHRGRERETVALVLVTNHSISMLHQSRANRRLNTR